MIKYSSTFKAKVVSRYLKGGTSYGKLAKEFGISTKSQVGRWVQRVRAHGYESLKISHTRKHYSQAFKIEVVEYTHQTSRALTAAHFNISDRQVGNWCQIVRDEGVDGLRSKPKSGQSAMSKHKQIKPFKRLEPTQEEKYKQEILELKQQLHEAELDRDILKALATPTKNSPKRSPRA
jgi:transposase